MLSRRSYAALTQKPSDHLARQFYAFLLGKLLGQMRVV
jgi:hypothetical protein